MKKTRDGKRRFSREFKMAAVRRVIEGESPHAVARDLDVKAPLLWRWRKQVAEKGEKELKEVGRPKGSKESAVVTEAGYQRRIGELERVGGTAADGNPFFRQSLGSSRGATPGEERRWRSGIYKAISQQMQMQGDGLTIREMCESAQVSRASYYRSWRQKEPREERAALRDAIQRLALKDRHCGYRRIGAVFKAGRLGSQSQAGLAVDA